MSADGSAMQSAPRSAVKGPKGVTLTGAASRSYSVASTWEKTAALDEEQLKVVELLSDCCSQRPYPAHVAEDASTSAPSSSASSAAAAAGGAAAAAAGGAAAGAAGTAGRRDSYAGTLEDAVLQNTNQFYKWHTELESACASETEQKYKQYADLLNGHLMACEGIQLKVTSTLELFDSLLSLHSEVTGRSSALSGACESLVREKSSLEEFADALRARLHFFDEYEAVYAQFHAAQATTDSTALLSLLKRLDECIAYVTANPQYADAVSYGAKFRQLQSRALGMVRNRAQHVLRAAAAQVQAGAAEASGAVGGVTAAVGGGGSSRGLGRQGSSGGAGGGQILPEGAEVAVLYVRFRAAAESSLKGLFQELEARGQQPEYARLLDECRGLYCATRQQLVGPFVAQRIAALAQTAGAAGAGAPLPLLLRHGCEQLLRVAQMEGQLAEHFFRSGGSGGAQGPGGGVQGSGFRGPAMADALRPLLEPLATVLYDWLRPRFVQLHDFDELCELVDILKHEVLSEQVARRGGAVEALAPMLLRALSDLQGRLIYRCQAFIKSEVETYQPTPDDISFPARLAAMAADAAQQQEHANGVGAAANGSSTATTATADGEIQEAADGAPEDEQQPHDPEPDPYAHWYPPLRNTLLMLAKLYRAVDANIFAGLAQEAVAAATASVQTAAKLIARSTSSSSSGGVSAAAAGPAAAAGTGGVGATAGGAAGAAATAAGTAASGLSGPALAQLDAQLFVIKHLLFLREQIAPFDVEFAATDVDLDFSHMRDHMRRILAGEASLFTLSSSNAMVQMLGRGGPRVITAQIDSKRDLEQQLKAACEGFIMGVTKAAVDPMLSFITKVTVVRSAAASGNAANARQLKEQAFATPAKLADLITRVNGAVQAQLPAVVNRTRLYLSNPNTRAILFRPIKSNIAEAHGQIANLLEAEYSPEEAASIPLMQPQQLGAMLDALS